MRNRQKKNRRFDGVWKLHFDLVLQRTFHLTHVIPAVHLDEFNVAYSTAAKGYDCAFCDKSTKIGTLVVLYTPLYIN